MRHKYLPRVGGVVLLAGAGLAGAGLGCSDATGPAARGPQLLLTLEAPPSDSSAQLGVAITAARSDSVWFTEVRVYVDSAAGVQPSSVYGVTCVGQGQQGGKPRWSGVVLLPGPGRHTVTVVGVDTTGRATSASAAWTVRVPSESYTVTALPDSGRGASTRFVHANGTVTGWVAGQNGQQFPAVWRNGALTALGGLDSADGVAMRVNAAGDVLLDYNYNSIRQRSPYPQVGDPQARVRRADGATLVIGPYTFQYPVASFVPSVDTVCCQRGVDLTETRLAVGRSGFGGFDYDVYATGVLDVARGARADSATFFAVGFNNAGQAVGFTRNYSGDKGLVARGFQAGVTPSTEPLFAGSCNPYDHIGAGSHANGSLTPVDLDESANVLAMRGGIVPVWLPAGGGTGRWLDRVVGQSRAIHLSRTGQIVASLDSAGAIYLWRPATNRTTQLRVAGDAWRIDSLAAVNASGQIAAHGVERATGRTAALLLTPVP